MKIHRYGKFKSISGSGYFISIITLHKCILFAVRVPIRFGKVVVFERSRYYMGFIEVEIQDWL